jgi:hypothetical protein
MDTFVVGWGSLALINAALANIDERGPLKYFLGSLFLAVRGETISGNRPG